MAPSDMGLFEGLSVIRARALNLGERLDVRALEQAQRVAVAPLVISAGERGAAVVFRYGVVVFFHVPPLEEVGLLAHLKPFIGDPYPKVESEELELRLAGDKTDSVEGSVISLADFSLERIQLVGEILAKSVVLARSEGTVRESISAIEGWARNLERTGAGGSLEKQLKKHLGATLLIQNTLAGRTEIGEKPDLLWDRHDLERLYLRLEDEYELKERDKTLERKLALIASTAEMLLNLVNNKRSNRLEWYIIFLILVEIAITVGTMAYGAL